MSHFPPQGTAGIKGDAGAAGSPGVSAIFSYTISKSGSNYVGTSGNSITPAYSDTQATFHTAFNNIIANINPVGTSTYIKITDGDFLLDDLASVPNTAVGNITIDGLGIGVTNINMSTGLDAKGTNYAWSFGARGTQAAGNTGTLTVNAAINDFTVTMSTGDSAKFTAGDWVKLFSTDIYSAQASGGAKTAEIYQVKSVNTGTGVVTLLTPVLMPHTTANGALLIKLTVLNNIKISNLTIKKHSSLTSTTINFFRAVHCIIQLENVQLVDNVADFQSGLVLESCIDSKASNIQMVQTGGNAGINQYGIVLYGCCTRVIVSDSDAYGNFRHPFEIGDGITGSDPMVAGQGRGLECNDCTVTGANTGGFDNHADAVEPVFNNCQVIGTNGGHGFEMRCTSPKLINPTVYGCNNQAIDISEEAGFAQIVNPTVKNCTSTGIRIRGVTDVQIQGGRITNCTFDGVLADAGSDRLSIQGLNSSGNTLSGIKATDSESINIAHNICKSNGSRGIDVNATIELDNVLVKDNTLLNNTTASLRLTSKVLGTSIIADNIGYNPAGTISTPFATSGDGDITNLSQSAALPATTTVQTVRQSPKTIIVTGGTVQAILINGTTVATAAGSYVYDLGIGETFRIDYTVNPTIVVRAK